MSADLKIGDRVLAHGSGVCVVVEIGECTYFGSPSDNENDRQYVVEFQYQCSECKRPHRERKTVERRHMTKAR